MYLVHLDRLIECLYLDDVFHHAVWNPNDAPLSFEEIDGLVNSGYDGDASPYGDTWKHPVKENRDREFHLNRVVYLVKHPEDINGIQIDNACDGMRILPKCIIDDGWHRLCAAAYRQRIFGESLINIYYGGRIDMLRYMQGKRKTIPSKTI